MSQPTRPMHDDEDEDEDDDLPTLADIESIFGPQNLPAGELVPMLERQLGLLEKELAALITHHENGKDLEDEMRTVRQERESVRSRLEEARFQRDRLN